MTSIAILPWYFHKSLKDRNVIFSPNIMKAYKLCGLQSNRNFGSCWTCLQGLVLTSTTFDHVNISVRWRLGARSSQSTAQAFIDLFTSIFLTLLKLFTSDTQIHSIQDPRKLWLKPLCTSVCVLLPQKLTSTISCVHCYRRHCSLPQLQNECLYRTAMPRAERCSWVKTLAIWINFPTMFNTLRITAECLIITNKTAIKWSNPLTVTGTSLE